MTRGGRPSPVESRRRAFLELIRRVPAGRVVTYGQVAALVGHPRHAREVGRTLATLPEGAELPWHRVVNAAGRVSPRGLLGDETHQRRLLEAEGVRFDRRGRIDLGRYRWEPPEAALPDSRPVE